MESRNDIPSNAKSEAAAILNARLADALDLALAVKQAHWNIRGPHFIAIHEMLDSLRGQLDGETDTIAERVAQLGQLAQGTAQAIAKASSLPPYPTEGHVIRDHLHALATRYGSLANQVRRDIATLDDLADPASADILTQTSRVLEKALWFLESHLSD